MRRLLPIPNTTRLWACGPLARMDGSNGERPRGSRVLARDRPIPVVGVNWNEAKKFCEWLTRREQGSGMLPHRRVYRLPTDAEWSAGLGLQGERGNNPKEKHCKIKLYPWGKEWPPPKGAANNNEGYPRTQPLGKFCGKRERVV
jgi:eukaryotic-like serine/threonine-protein kinase